MSKKTLIDAANREEIQGTQEKLDHFAQLIHLDKLEEEFKELSFHIKLYNKEAIVPIKRVTKVSTICEILSSNPCSKACLPEVHNFYISE